MRFIRILVVVGVVSLIMAGCSSTGISGLVDLGAPCPPDSNCKTPSGPATVLVSNEKGDPVTSVKTDEKGRFTVSVGPGKYILQAQRGEGFGPGYSSPPVVVEVKQGKFAPARLSLTGK